MRGQDMEGWFPALPFKLTPNPAPWMYLCLHTLWQKRFFMLPWSWDPCSLDGGSHCFCTSNSRGKNPCKGFIPLGFQISSLLVFLFRGTLSLSSPSLSFWNLLFVRFATMEAAGKLILVFVKSIAETSTHVWSVSFLSGGPFHLTEFVTWSHLRGMEEKCKT